MAETIEYDLGMVGLGVMGRNLVLNMGDHGFAVIGTDLDPAKVQALNDDAGDRKVRGVGALPEFMTHLKRPRAVMMLVPAGSPVDAVIHSVLPFIEQGDVLIDGGNSYYKDTNLRQKTLADKGINYLGVGISGGEHGARFGPSLMPGGPKVGYERVQSIFEAVAAKADGEPCTAYLGPGSAGHYVKMVHNGLEYGLMQLIAETYDLMKRGLGCDDADLERIYTRWNQGELNSYLMEITANIFGKMDERTGRRLIDVILDEAKQKGTGKWTSQDAMDLQVPIPTIDMAVSMRDLSAYKQEREKAEDVLARPGTHFSGDREGFINHLEKALYAGMVITFAQGMTLLRVASLAYGYGVNLNTVARIWRGGCIIRAALLEGIAAAYQRQPTLLNLLLDEKLGNGIAGKYQDDLRQVVRMGTEIGIPVPGFMACLSYYDGYRSGWSPANLIQAQRDYFGAHTYERVDTKGVFHTEWD